MLKKGRKEKCPCQKAWEKKMHAKEHEAKKRKRKKEIKIAYTFKWKAFIQKRESWFKEYQKYLELESYEKFHTLACLDQSVWLASPWGPFLT